MRQDRECKTCVAFSPETQECRISAPDNEEKRWPNVAETDWCDEYVEDDSDSPPYVVVQPEKSESSWEGVFNTLAVIGLIAIAAFFLAVGAHAVRELVR